MQKKQERKTKTIAKIISDNLNPDRIDHDNVRRLLVDDFEWTGGIVQR